MIQIYLTGGTIEKEYNELQGSLVIPATSQIDEILNQARNRVEVKIEKLMMVDSLEMTGKERQTVAEKVAHCQENKIIITHGTDTMVETGTEIKAKINLEISNPKTIILVGAMIPFQVGKSDALFNLGSAMAFVQALPPGVYIAMNGRYFDIEDCRKNKAGGFFENLK